MESHAPPSPHGGRAGARGAINLKRVFLQSIFFITATLFAVKATFNPDSGEDYATTMMKTIRFLMTGLIIMLALAGCASAATDAASEHVIQTTGTGNVIGTPDRAQVTFSVQTENTDVRYAQADNALRMAKVHDALIATGIPRDALKTTGYNIYPVYEESTGILKPKIKTYRVTNSLTVTLHNVSKTGEVIDKVAGEPRTFRVGFTPEHGQGAAAGAKLYLDGINAAGGVAGRRVAVLTRDDAGDAKRAAENTRELIERDNVVAMLGGVEGGPCVATLKEASDRGVPLIACMAGSPEMREPFNRWSFPVRAAHLDEFDHLLGIVKTYGYSRVAFVHADSDTGPKDREKASRDP